MSQATETTLRAALIEAQAGLEFAAAQLPQTTGFVPAHVAALQSVRAALSTAAAQPTDAELVCSRSSRVLAWQEAPQPAAQQGEPFGYFRAEPFGWTDCAEGDEGAVALYEKAGATDATLHKTIASVEAALDAAGAPAGTLVDRIAAMGRDAGRLDWLTFNISGKALRDIGVIWSEHGDARRAIDAARAQQEER